jgi:uncharacterized membrane protein YcaP (DUF421 family)
MADLLRLGVHPGELFFRGTVVYLGLVLVFRFILRRDVGTLGVPDILFVVLIADASQNAIAGEYRSITDGAVLVGTLIFWNLVLDWLAYKSRWFRKLTDPPTVPLITDGKWVRKNLRSQWITTDEVRSKLREQGVADIEAIKSLTLESDGEIGVIKFKDSDSGYRPQRKAPGV